MSEEQAQSYFLERQNSYHQNLHSLAGKKKSKRKSKNATPIASNAMRKSSSGSTFSSSSPLSLSPGGNGVRKKARGDEQVDDEELGSQSKPLLNSESTPSLRGSGSNLRQYGTQSSNKNNNNIMRIPSALLTQSQRNHNNTIRFQVVVWNIGKLDVVTGSVPMTFRVSLFWNDAVVVAEENDDEDDLLSMDDTSLGDDGNLRDGSNNNINTSSVRSVTTTASSSAAMSHITWKMHGRSKAIPQDFGGSAGFLIPPRNSSSSGNIANNNNHVTTQTSTPPSILDVPPLSILNVATFETIGGAEIDCLDATTKLFRWTAMYRATVLQTDVGVEDFPHDLHRVQLKLAILSQRSRGRQWDATQWRLALATEEDSQCSTRVPYGLIVDQVKIPGFGYNKERGLQFDLLPLNHGSNNSGNSAASFRQSNATATNHQGGHDEFLRVSVMVLRESGYYDQNIVPLVALLNVVAVSVLTFQDSEFFYRALITLNIAFVEMSIRMTADSHLPSVGYQIKLQRMLNEWFVILMMLVLEGMLVFVLRIYFGINENITKSLDWITALMALGHNVWRVLGYYRSKKEARHRLEHGSEDERLVKKTM